MPLSTWNLEWLNHNSQRNYPLADTASCVDVTGSFSLPDDFIVEMDLPVHAGMNIDPARFFIKNVGVYSAGYSIVVGYKPVSVASPPIDVATAFIPKLTHTTNKVYTLGGIGDFNDTIGKIVIHSLQNIDLQPSGYWEFSFDGGQLDPDVIRPIIRGVSSISCSNGLQKSQPFYGDIELVAGTNCQLVPIIQPGDPPKISINFIWGAGASGPNNNCPCEDGTANLPPITTISGIGPDATGNFVIAGSDCITVQPIPNGIKLINNCSKPCCGCEELEAITRDLEKLLQRAGTVEEFINNLSSTIETLNRIISGSNVSGGTTGCS